MSRNFVAAGWPRTKSRTGSSRPESGFSSGSQYGFVRKRTSKTRSASSGNPVLEAEGDDVDPEIIGAGLAWHQREQAVLELPDREAGGVDDVVGELAGAGQQPSLLGDAGLDSASRGLQRVAVARLAEPAHQARVAGLQEDQLEMASLALEGLGRPRDGRGRVARADVEDERGPAVPFRLQAAQREEVIEEHWWQVVDAGVAQILEELAGLALPGARQAGDDQEVLDLDARCARRSRPRIRRRGG